MGKERAEAAEEDRAGGMERDLEGLRQALRAFVAEREWGQFHTPKNLAIALSVEASELLELFQWLTPEQSGALPEATREALADEIGDVLIYLVMLADRCGLDPLAAARAKMVKNRRKYPAGQVRGKALKYTQYPDSADPKPPEEDRAAPPADGSAHDPATD